MQTQSSTLRLVSVSPHRAHARAVLAMAHEDVERGVLQERVAEFLCLQANGLRRGATASLAAVSPAEANTYRQWALGILRLSDEIRAERPPTPFEVARYEQGKALVLAHGRVRCHATSNGHALSVWRPDPLRDGYEWACCERCRAGASIHIGTGEESLSDDLLRVCPGAPFLRGVQR